MITPNLSLDFTTATLDPLVTFTRTTGASNPATYVDSTGFITAATNDQPRFDYDPVTLTCKGLLVEESRANFLRYSQDLSQTAWVVISSTLGANGISPDATANASNVVENTVANFHGYYQNITYAAQTYTLSAYVKRSSGTRNFSFRVRTTVSSGTIIGVATFDLTNGVVLGATTGTASIQNAGNGWYRCFLTFTSTAANYWTNFLIVDGTTASYTGNGTSGLYIWGAQLEAGAFATSYIPTTSASLTRNADVATITGTNFSDFWQASKGGAQVQATPSTVSGIRPLVQYDDGTANEIIALRGNTTNPELYIVDGGTPQAQLDAGTIAANTAYSLTGWWQTNDCKARKDSGAVVTDDAATIPTVTQARLGSDGTNYLNGHLATVNYYDSFFGQSIYTRRKNKVIFSLL